MIFVTLWLGGNGVRSGNSTVFEVVPCGSGMAVATSRCDARERRRSFGSEKEEDAKYMMFFFFWTLVNLNNY